MGVKITQLIGKFPTNNEYQIVDVTQICIKDGKKSLAVKFQNISTQSTTIITKYIPVAYARLIVIGTIWKNNAKVKFPSFLNQYQASNFDFSHLALSEETIEFDEFGKVYIEKKKENSNKPDKENYSLVTYDVDLSLVKEAGITNLLKPQIDKGNQNTIEFISFFSHELFRYFLTSYEISDLNGHFYSHNNAQGKWKESNEVFNVKESIEKDRELCISFDNSKYVNDTNLIGDCIYIPSYRNIIFSIQNFLNTNGYAYLSRIDSFPIERFTHLTFAGIPITRRSDGAKGLLAFLIKECTEYRPHEYTAILPEWEANDENSDGGGGPKPVPSGNNSNQTPTVRNNSTSSNKTHTIDETGLEFLLEQQTTHKVKKVQITTEGGGPVIPIVDKDPDKIAEPGKDGEPGGKIPKLNEYFPQTIYFKDYKVIIEGIVNEIKSKGLSISVSHYVEKDEWSDKLSDIQRSLFNENISNSDITEDLLYITQLYISNGTSLTKIFYLFEANNGSRTLLYASVAFKGIAHDGIINCLKYFPKTKNTSNSLNGAVVHYFNHQQRKKVNIERDERGIIKDYDLIQVTKDEAINDHIRKISNQILSQLIESPQSF